MSEVLPEVGHPRPYALLPRLIALELRKCADTRVMRWVLWIVLLLMCGVVTLSCVYDARASASTSASTQLTLVSSLFGLPLGVLGIVIMSSDWATRNTHVYFPRVRSRGAIFVAKLSAVCLVVVGFAAALFTYLALSFATLHAMGRHPRWDAGLDRWAVCFLVLLNGALVGAAVASLLRAAAASIVVIFSAATVSVLVLTLTIPDAVKLALSSDTHLRPLLEPLGYRGAEFMPPTTPWSVALSLLLWIIGPLAAGAWLSNRAEA